ncbi:Uncharacterised protein [Bordetella ansorpii]|uniref:Uncharacterized protein n=1 Tax=Bordetella ansorpii TaxID=288768 RepID=A0A157RMT4_9BORD|nr:hypothetical protein [Bordetella ansorpii]SAI59176.1 Uncharacterised protein [Bordetella ansorpii]
MNETNNKDASEYTVTDVQPDNENGQTFLWLLGIAAALIVTGTGLNWLFG